MSRSKGQRKMKGTMGAAQWRVCAALMAQGLAPREVAAGLQARFPERLGGWSVPELIKRSVEYVLYDPKCKAKWREMLLQAKKAQGDQAAMQPLGTPADILRQCQEGVERIDRILKRGKTKAITKDGELIERPLTPGEVSSLEKARGKYMDTAAKLHERRMTSSTDEALAMMGVVRHVHEGSVTVVDEGRVRKLQALVALRLGLGAGGDTEKDS